MIYYFTVPLSVNETCCSEFLPAVITNFLDFDRSYKCVLISLICFGLYFPNDKWSEVSFHMFVCHLCIVFSKMTAKLFILFLLNFKNFYFLITFSFFKYVIFKYFSQPVSVLLIILTIFFHNDC